GGRAKSGKRAGARSSGFEESSRPAGAEYTRGRPKQKDRLSATGHLPVNSASRNHRLADSRQWIADSRQPKGDAMKRTAGITMLLAALGGCVTTGDGIYKGGAGGTCCGTTCGGGHCGPTVPGVHGPCG